MRRLIIALVTALAFVLPAAGLPAVAHADAPGLAVPLRVMT